MMTVYLDQVFLLNTAIDYLLLLTGAKLAGTPLRRGRFLFCAMWGGIYAVATFLADIGGILTHPMMKLLSGIGLAWAAYGREVRPWRMVCLFFMLSGGFAGILLAIGLASGSPGVYFSSVYYGKIDWPVLISSVAVISLLLHLIFRQGARHGGGSLMDVEISIAGKTKRLSVLHDTGNTLRNPVNGRPVLVMEQESLQDLWPDEIREVLRNPCPPETKMARLYETGIPEPLSFSLLPFRSVGVPSGLLLAVNSDYICINRKRYKNQLIALTPGSVSDGGGYHGLWGGEESGRKYEKTAAEIAAMDSSTQQAG